MNVSAHPAVAASAAWATHGWHLAGGAAFLLVGLGVAAIADARQRTAERRPPQRPAGRVGVVTTSHAVAGAAVAAVATVGAAAVHLTVTPEHFEESALYGAFFLVLALVQLAWAGVTALRPTRTLLVAGAAANVAVVVLWLATRLVAIPIGPATGTRETFGALDLLASGFEVAAIVGALVALAGSIALPRRHLRRVATSPAWLVAVAAVTAVVASTATAAPPS